MKFARLEEIISKLENDTIELKAKYKKKIVLKE